MTFILFLQLQGHLDVGGMFLQLQLQVWLCNAVFISVCSFCIKPHIECLFPLFFCLISVQIKNLNLTVVIFWEAVFGTVFKSFICYKV